MASLRHPNICQFLGACMKLPYLCIILEYCPNKNLMMLLTNKKIGYIFIIIKNIDNNQINLGR